MLRGARGRRASRAAILEETMRRWSIITIFSAVAILAPLALPGGLARIGWAAQDDATMRAPFALEIPEINSGLLTEMDTYVPLNVTITRLLLWVVRPYDERISKYSKINASINGRSAGPITKKLSGKHGKFLDLDLTQNVEFKLRSGKNVIEITAEDDAGKSYRAQFVLLPGVAPASKPDAPVSSEITIESFPAPDNSPLPSSDRTPPRLTLTEPTSAITLTGSSVTVNITGEAGDDAGSVVSVTVNGRKIAGADGRGIGAKKPKKGDPPPAPERLTFNHQLQVEAGLRSVLVEATDRAGNRTLATIPVLQPAALATNRFGGRKFAVLIGVSEYKYNEGGLGDLSYAHKDAEAIRDFLKTPNGGNFLDADILYLVNDQATLATVSDALKRFLTKAGPNDLIYLFLAGHGAPDPYDPQRLYFLLHDTKVADIPNTAFPMERLREFLDQQKSQARLICFLDTCHSAGVSTQTQTTGGKAAGNAKAGGRGISAKGVGAKPPGAPPGQSAPSADFNFYDRRLFQEKSWAVITSSSRDETSQESPKWGQGHGVFTWALLEGLRGAADENRDCVISAGEIFKYVTERVRRETSDQQNPQSLPGANPRLVVAATPTSSNCKR
jgi:uncharacterized caspase-like protein